jgi:hypothetical protein
LRSCGGCLMAATYGGWHPRPPCTRSTPCSDLLLDLPLSSLTQLKLQ